MLEKLKQRCQVNDINLALIICTFALGGSLCGLAAENYWGLREFKRDLYGYCVIFY